MAQFPNAVVSFATKNPGDTIPSADWNSQNAEIVAIEDGYLNGTARLNSSNSTAANLSVTGNSTIAGNLTVGGTITGSITLSTIVTNNTQPRCRAFHGSSQTLQGNSSLNVLTFNSDDFNVGSIHSTGSNPTRLTIQSTGVWLFGATVQVNVVPLGNLVFAWMRKNGATQVGSAVGGPSAGGSVKNFYKLSMIEQMTSTGDYMEVIVTQNTAGTLESGNVSSRVDQNEFWAVKLW